jgi:hypothetical protein
VTGTWDNEAAPSHEVKGSVLENRANMSPLGSGTSITELSVTDGYRRPGGDHGSMPTRQCGPLVNNAHF